MESVRERLKRARVEEYQKRISMPDNSPKETGEPDQERLTEVQSEEFQGQVSVLDDSPEETVVDKKDLSSGDELFEEELYEKFNQSCLNKKIAIDCYKAGMMALKSNNQVQSVPLFRQACSSNHQESCLMLEEVFDQWYTQVN